GPVREAEIRPERARCGPQSVRLLAHPPRDQDARGPHGAALRQRGGDGAVPRGPQGGLEGPLSRVAGGPRSSGREEADATLRWHAELRNAGRCEGRRAPSASRGHRPRRELGRGRVAHRAARVDDALQCSEGAAREAGHHGGTRPILRRTRGRRGPAGRLATGPWLTTTNEPAGESMTGPAGTPGSCGS